jgi:hypothetical protein
LWNTTGLVFLASAFAAAMSLTKNVGKQSTYISILMGRISILMGRIL